MAAGKTAPAPVRGPRPGRTPSVPRSGTLTKLGLKVREAGAIIRLLALTIRAIGRPVSYLGELTEQIAFVLRTASVPLVLSAVAICYGAAGIQAANIFQIFGATDRLPSFFVLAAIREFAPFVTAVVTAGVAGTAITADLGARKIREELDALLVLGVDPIKSVVVPRFIALIFATCILNVLAIVAGVVGGVITVAVVHASLGTFASTVFTTTSALEFQASMMKAVGYGAIVATVCCYKGLATSGGAEGVGRAVNQAVVVSFICVFAFNFVFTQLLLATNPDLSIVR